MSTSDPDMPTAIDFSGTTRDKFHREGITLRPPVYLDDPIQARLSAIASAKGIELSDLVNSLLRKDLELMNIATPTPVSYRNCTPTPVS